MSRDTKGWIPTHDGKRVADGSVHDPYIRNSDAYGPMPPYLVFFTSKEEANTWCEAVGGAVALACNYGEASRIAQRLGAELLES